MHSYWYLSEDKLQALGALDAGLLGRLSTRAKLGVGVASVEVGLDHAAARTLGRSAAKAEKQLRRQRAIADVADFASGPPPAVYFDSNGPACRAVIAGMFWVAGVHDDVAVLLVGSASNAVAARPTTAPSTTLSPSADPMGAARYLRDHPQQVAPTVAPDEVFSPSVDPIGAARYLLAHPQQTAVRADGSIGADAEQVPDPNLPSAETLTHVDTLAYAWKALMERSLDLLSDDISALPRAQSVSQYVARHRIKGLAHGWQAGVKSLVLGTPVYVAQVT